MQLNDAIILIQNDYFKKINRPSIWADMGCGTGLFTYALAGCLPSGSMIYAVDKRNFLKKENTADGIEIIPLKADFVKNDLRLNNLSGMLMANSLHYVKDKSAFIEKVKSYLKNDSCIIIVEYDTDSAVRQWVPYPVSFYSLEKLFRSTGFSVVLKIGERPSAFQHNNMYAAFITR